MPTLRAVVEEGSNEYTVASVAELKQILDAAAVQARGAHMLNIVSLYAPNGDNLFLVVGGDLTVAGFNYGHGDPPYYVSKGSRSETDPPLTAYLGLAHHTEFPAQWVIPMDDGRRAAFEFIRTANKPEAIEWTQT